MNISQQLPSRLDSIPGFISKAINELQEEFPLNEDDVFQLRLALEESLTNAIKHGNKLDPNLKVNVSIISQGDRLTIEVKDEGQGFDFNSVPDPTIKENVLMPSGRGVFLMRKIMDEVSFLDGGRRVRMVKTFRK